MSKRTIALVGALSAVIVTASLVYNFNSNPKPCPLPDYTSYHGSPQDLLILEGRCVVPTAIDAIRDRTLPRRSNVISFLGDGAHKEALESLVKIIEDETDSDRDFAIIAVFRIDNEKGRELAKKYQAEVGDLGEYSRDILADENYLHDRKTYWQAWRNYIAEIYAL